MTEAEKIMPKAQSFESYLSDFYRHYAAHFGPDQNGEPCTSEEVRKWGLDENALRRRFLSGVTASDAAWNEYDAACALG